MSAGLSTIRAAGYLPAAADFRTASDVEIASSEKAGFAAMNGAWKTLPERPKPATAVRMGRAESLVICLGYRPGSQAARLSPAYHPRDEFPPRLGEAVRGNPVHLDGMQQQ